MLKDLKERKGIIREEIEQIKKNKKGFLELKNTLP